MRKKIFIGKNQLPFIILLIIIVFGAFLRSEHFHDWARFNGDQARDAAVIDKAVENGNIPLLGPKAGGTIFKLGPAFYYFQYLAARLFGNRPDVLAYPTLFFGILSIPLLYLIFRKIFSEYISISAAILFSFSVFVIKFSRFAWNPNQAPFFIFLTILLLPQAFGFFSDKHRKSSSVAVGISAGIAIQLHTLLMILLPAVIALTAIRAKMYKKKISLVIAIIVFMVITVNLPQIYSEIKTGGANSREFIKGIGVKTGQNKNFGEKTLRVSECFLKNNYYVFSALGGNDGCTFFKKSKTTSLLEFYVRLIFSIIFLVGGVFIGLRNWQNEKEPGKRAYLEMMMFMAFVAFFLFLPFAKYVSMRYFMVILFWPFLLAGFWLKKIVDSSQKSKYFITGFLIVAFIGLNIRTYWQTFSAKITQSNMQSEFFGGIRLGDAESSADYIIEETKKHDLQADKIYIGSFKYAQSLSYLIRKKTKVSVSVLKKWPPKEKVPFFFMERGELIQKILDKKFKDFQIDDYRVFDRYVVFKMTPL